MRRSRVFERSAGVALVACSLLGLLFSQSTAADERELWRHRNLGKAFYENPATPAQAVEEFRKALALAPDSLREQINYGLALIRAGDTRAGIAALEKAQKRNPQLPQTWFNLGVAFKRQGDLDPALAQFRGMERLAPEEPATHYQIGFLLKTKGDLNAAVKEFETARNLNPRLAAPHFQLFGLYRQLNRPTDAAAELRTFQEIKKQQQGAAVAEDMEWSVYSEIYEAPPAASPALSNPVFQAQRLAAGFSGVTSIRRSPKARPDLIAWSASEVVLFRDGKTAVDDSGLENLREVVSIAPGDFDNDGFTDLCVITTSGASLYRNVNGKFRKQIDLAAGSFRQAVWLDYDHDYDLDLFLIGDHPVLLRNNLAAGFSDETRHFPFVAGMALSATRFDLEPDTPGFDLIVSYRDRVGVLYRDHLGGHYTAVAIPKLPPGAADLFAYDFNHDGRTDLIAQPDLYLLNHGNFEAAAKPRGEIPLGSDFDGDGRLSRARIADGALLMEHDVSPNSGNWVEVSLQGVKNLKTSIGSKVEIEAGAQYEKQTYEGLPLVFRIGAAREVDTIRITWPNGLIQNQVKQPANRILTIVEAPRLAGSCPMIFTWNGERFQFISDVLGVAPLGASSGDGQYFPVDHQEYVSIPGSALKPRDSVYEVRLTEELREVSYIDQIKLQAVDHPANVEIITNERFKSPPFPEFRLFGAARRIYPVTARDQRGTDVTAALRRRDSVYPDAFRRDQAGVAEMHHLDLNFGNAAASNHAVLILYGWVDWADGSSFLSAAQEHRDLTFPYLQVKDAAGSWKTVIEDMGMPSGKPKAIAVDLTGKFLSRSREVRIVTNLCVYWDEIFLTEDDARPATRLTTAPLLSSDLHFRGFSRATIDPQRKQPEQFDYQNAGEMPPWNPTPGNYTRYGPVGTLLGAADDRMVIMGSGDEIAMRFSAAGFPPLPAGWTRDFILLVDGWAKDADANTAFSQSVLPLPFHAMSRYPYPAGETYPRDALHRDYLRDYLTRPALRLIRPLSEGR